MKKVIWFFIVLVLFLVTFFWSTCKSQGGKRVEGDVVENSTIWIFHSKEAIMNVTSKNTFAVKNYDKRYDSKGSDGGQTCETVTVDPSSPASYTSYIKAHLMIKSESKVRLVIFSRPFGIPVMLFFFLLLIIFAFIFTIGLCLME